MKTATPTAGSVETALEGNRRGPNAARREATREKLLNASVECLYKHGYWGASTVLVTQVAGVSRGSLLHQFPTKADLMLATAQHIALMRGKAHREGLAGVPRKDRLPLLVDILWGEVTSPSGIARIEIMLAARSDQELAAIYMPFHAAQEQRQREAIWDLAQALGARRRHVVDAVTQLYTASLRGLSIDHIYPHSREGVLGAVALLKRVMVAEIEREIAQGQPMDPNQAEDPS